MAEVQTGTKPALATVLTGFETPLGRSAAQALARAGHRLCVIRGDGAPADQGLSELPGHDRLKHQAIAAELADAAAVQRTAKEAQERLGQVTGLLHVPALAPQGAQELDPQRFAQLMQRGPGAFLGLALALLPEMFATQSGALCVLAAAPGPGASWAECELGAAASLGALLGAVAQLADRCAGTPVRSFLLHCSQGDSTRPHGSQESEALSASAQTALAAQFADLAELPASKRSAETALVENGARASLDSAGLRARIELLAAPVVAAPAGALAVEAARQVPVANGVSGGPGAPAAPDRISERLGQTFRSVFGLAASADLAGCAVGSVPRWDSLGHLKLMMEVERSLRVRLPAEALAKIQSYRDLERAVRAQLAAV